MNQNTYAIPLSSRAVWCLWLGGLLGIPYVLSFSEPAGTVSFSGTYSFVALGILIGIWLCSFPNVASLLHTQSKPMRSVWFLCAALTLLLFAAELARYIYLADRLEPMGERLFSPIPGDNGISRYLADLTCAIGLIEKPLTCILSLSCVTYGYARGFISARTSKHAESCQSTSYATMLAAFCAGVLRMYAWALLMPHAKFPLPVPDATLMQSEYWSASFSLSALLPCLAVSILIYFTTNKKRLNESYLSAICAGELLMRALTRLWPNILAIPFAFSAASLGVHALILIVSVFSSKGDIVFRKSKDKSVYLEESHFQQPYFNNTNSIQDALSNADKEYLLKHGLTQGELNAVRGAILGLSSSEAARVFGIKPSTIRAYRGRVCSKLSIASIEELAVSIIQRTGPFSNNESNEYPSETGMGNSGAEACFHLLAGVFSCLGLTLLPHNSIASVWNMIWLVSFGAALGLVCSSALIQHPRTKQLLTTRGITQLNSAILILVLCAVAYCHQMPTITYSLCSSWWGRVVVIATATCCTACSIIILLAVVKSHRAAMATPTTGRISAVVALIVALACLGQNAWYLSAVICCILFLAGILRLRTSANPNQSNNDMDADKSSLTLFPLIVLVGFAWEEAWREQAYTSLAASFSPYLLLLIAHTSYHLLKGEASVAKPYVVCCYAGTIPVVLSLGLCAGLVTLLGLLASWKFIASFKGANKPLSIWHNPLMAFAAGQGMGVYCGNMYGTELLKLGDYASRAIFAETVMWGLGFILFFIALFICHAADCSLRTETLSTKLAESEHSVRVRGYFESKGLSETHCEVLTLLVRGLSVDEISQELGYSKSSIGRMRLEGLARLNARNRLQLLEQVTKLLKT